MPQSVLDWGINSTETVYFPYWRNPYVTAEDKQILVSLWQLSDRVMLGVFNYDREKVKDVKLKRVRNRLVKEDLITPEEYKAMIVACGNNFRLKALIADLAPEW